jgi:hypothetical protein
MKISEYATMFPADLVFFTARLIEVLMFIKEPTKQINNL